jgi:aminopeptidase N
MRRRPALSAAAAWLLALCLLVPSGPARAQQGGAPHDDPAADAAPAEGHAGVDARHYRFALTLREDANRISGVATARVRFLADTLDALALDLVGKSGATGMTVESVERIGTGEALDFSHANERLRIALAEAPEQGETRAYRIRYGGVPADGLIIAENQFGDRTFFGDHWPTRARHYLPSIDHPADKATVAFEVTAPDAYQVIAGGRLEERTDLPGPTSVTRYRTHARLPMKVAVIGAARFAVSYPSTAAETPLESWVYPQNRSEGFDQMAQAERILEYFAENIGPFPFEKLANVESKTRYGGMENAGSIFYSEDAVAEGEGIEPLLAHEIAHQWFGDAVTEASYAHLWLSEGFATYLTDLFIEATYGEERFRKRMRRERQAVAEFARKKPAAPLVDASFDEATEILDSFRYQKGAWVLHMLRRKVGLEAFWDGLALHYERYRGGNADTQDFRRSMEAASGQDLAAFFEQWTQGPALPRYEGTWRYADGRVVVELRQRAPEDFTFALPLEIGIYPREDAEPRIETVDVNARQETVSFAVEGEPGRVALDPNANTLMTADFGRE